MKPQTGKRKCCCCQLWIGMLIVGLLTLLEFFGMVGEWLQCMKYDACVARDYMQWMGHAFAMGAFLILAATRGNIASRQLVRDVFAIEAIIASVIVAIFAILWFSKDWSKMTCDMLTFEDYRMWNPNVCGIEAASGTMSNFVVEDSGVTLMASDPNWNPATFSSEREMPYCSMY